MEVTVSRITKSFAGAQGAALNGVSVTAQANRITSLVGASGCGKTTTLRCIAGLETPDSGEIRFGEQVVTANGRVYVPTAERNLGMVFQSYALWPHLTVAENIAFGLRARRWPKARIRSRIDEVLSLVELPGFGDRYPAQLSGGQQQRVALGRALSYEPAVLLMDEPLANLDAHLRGQMRQAIRRLQRQTRVTMIYVTHDRAEAMELSDSIVILDRGRVVQVGSPSALFERPDNALVARFLGHSNFLPATVTARCDDAVDIHTSFGQLRVAGVADCNRELSLLVQSDAIHLCSPDNVDRAGWLRGKGKVLTASRGSGGIVCTLETDAGNIDMHLPGHTAPALDEEIHFHIDPARCKVLPLHAQDDR